MTPFKNILSSYLQRPGGASDPRTIAKGPVLLSFAGTVVALLMTIRTLSLTESQLQKLSGKGGAGQRQRSRAFQEFLAKRPDFAAQTEVDPQVLQQVIDKDEAFDTLAYVAAALITYFHGADLQLGAFLSEQGDKVLAYLQKLQHGPAPLKGLDPLTVTFVPVEMEAGKQDQAALDRAQRQARAVQAAQATLQATRDRIGRQHQIGQLTQAAASGTVGLPFQHSNTNKKGA